MKEYKLFLFLIIFLIKIQFSKASAFEHNQIDYKYVKRRHSESSYQHAWCSAHGGIEEFENSDKTRVDCVTDTYAVEFDFANKWAESIGQALHYQLMTGKKAMVVLILEEPKKEKVYYHRVKRLGKIHNFDVEFVTPKLLNIADNKCQYEDCKCKK